MVVHNLNIMGSVRLPPEANAPLIVDAHGVLAFAVALEGFQAIAGRNPQLSQFGHGVKLGELAQGGTLDVRREGADFLQPKQAGGGIAGEGADHALRWLNHNGTR